MDSDISIGSSPKQSYYNKYKKKKKNNSKSKIAYKILDAAHLRDDFYSNLISWSKSSGKIAVGLGSNVHLWSDTEGVDSLELPETQIISCLSWSDGEMVLVASTSGDIRLFFQGLGVVIDCNNPSGQGICCITWVPGSESQFYAGDEAGYVLYFEIEDRQLLKLVHWFKCHQHQVCGIAISNDLKEITVGGNDNCCTIWDVENIKAPVLKYYLAHKAAVKAVAYCPWSKSLLATGGGSKDRTIRFWHTSTGSLLNSHKTKGQITSLIWSKRKRQITATYGFGDVDKPIFLSVLSYPDMETLAEVEAAPNLRALSAVMSPDATSICVAANDETVRFYKLWDAKDPIILDYQQNGVFGSDIIELSEGITTHGDFIR
jgi:meiosis-specific APC/C activator protein AMA1